MDEFEEVKESELTRAESDSILESALTFKEPVKGYDATFTEVPVDKLEIISYQRKPSKAHVSNLVKSIAKFGFVVPLVVSKKDEVYIILDGQHRYLASLELGITKLPCVIVPWELANLMLSLNIEKQPNIKERAYVALRIYQSLMEELPEKPETEPEILDSMDELHLVTMGLVYEIKERFAGSAYEPVMKKTDLPLDLPLKDAWNERGRRAKMLEEVDNIVTGIVEKLKDMGRWHPFIYKEVVSFANPIRRKRLVVDFDEVFLKMKEALEHLNEHPETIGTAELEE